MKRFSLIPRSFVLLFFLSSFAVFIYSGLLNMDHYSFIISFGYNKNLNAPSGLTNHTGQVFILSHWAGEPKYNPCKQQLQINLQNEYFTECGKFHLTG